MFVFLSIGAFERRDEGHEEVDDVEVERDGCGDVLVVGVALDEVVGVVDDEPGEHQRGDAAVHHRRGLAHREQNLQCNRSIGVGRSMYRFLVRFLAIVHENVPGRARRA